jgi:hypothetical protein
LFEGAEFYYRPVLNWEGPGGKIPTLNFDICKDWFELRSAVEMPVYEADLTSLMNAANSGNLRAVEDSTPEVSEANNSSSSKSSTSEEQTLEKIINFVNDLASKGSDNWESLEDSFEEAYPSRKFKDAVVEAVQSLVHKNIVVFQPGGGIKLNEAWTPNPFEVSEFESMIIDDLLMYEEECE